MDTANQRDASADARDVAALARDQAATDRDAAMAVRDGASEQFNGARMVTGAEIVVRAAGERKACRATPRGVHSAARAGGGGP